jgi:hypothetical protein
MDRRKVPNLQITVGETTVSIRRDGSTSVLTAGIVGRELKGKAENIYLDRVVHRPEDLCAEWSMGGGYSTILARST